VARPPAIAIPRNVTDVAAPVPTKNTRLALLPLTVRVTEPGPSLETSCVMIGSGLASVIVPATPVASMTSAPALASASSMA
jgi:hypothetical protein